jgi:hypothetical protein
MILAGIDEAGYGPLLGPLVVGCCAFEVAPGAVSSNPAELPCLWARLRKHVSKNRLKSGRKLHVNDSKVVYSPSIGLKELERSVLAFTAAAGEWPGDLLSFVSRVAAHAVEDLAGYSWYQPPAGEAFPLEQEDLPVRLFAKALRQEMDRSGARLVHLGARVVFERQLNRMLEATRNKASTLFSVSATHLDHLLRTYGDQDLTIVCDRQGGRGHYGPLLRLMFEEWSLEIVNEQDARSEYRLTRGGHSVRIFFAEKAEAQCMPVALASMLSKYLRETMMRRFNAWWRQHLPDVAPTAGYYGDGARFLNDIDAKRRELGIADAELIRAR